MTASRPIPAADPIPARAGVGLKPEHYQTILDEAPDLGWFEIHAENYMEAGGPPHHFLGAIRDRYPISVHGVGLSIGTAGSLDLAHLARLKQVCERYQPGLVSEHLAWSTHEGHYLNDLLPVPLTRATLDKVCEHIALVQDTLERRILLENPSTYVRFSETDMAETDFLAEVAERTGCGLLLDVNNVFVQATNHDFAPDAYIDAFPLHAVGEIHVAGHAEDTDDDGAPLLIDAHGSPVCDPVWALLERVLKTTGRLPVLVEWDNDVPAFDRLHAEAKRAERLLSIGGQGRANAA